MRKPPYKLLAIASVLLAIAINVINFSTTAGGCGLGTVI